MSEIKFFLQEVLLPLLISGGTAFLVVKYLSKAIISHLLKKDIEKYKNELNEKTENLKTNLSIYANEQQISFRRVDEKRASAIHEIYREMDKVTIAFSTFITSPSRENISIQEVVSTCLIQLDEMNKNVLATGQTLSKHAIYLDNDTYTMINDYFAKISKITQSFGMFLLGLDFGKIEFPSLEAEKNRITKIFFEELVPIHREVVDNFRVILGVEKKKQFLKN